MLLSEIDFCYRFLGVLSASSSVIYCILIVISLILQFPVAKSDTNTYPWSWTHVFLAFGVVIFSYGGAITFPTVQHDMKDPSKFSKVVALSFSGKHFRLFDNYYNFYNIVVSCIVCMF